MVLARLALPGRDSERAETEARKALQMDPTAAASWSVLGDARPGASFLEETASDYERALPPEPDHVEAMAGPAVLAAARSEIRSRPEGRAKKRASTHACRKDTFHRDVRQAQQEPGCDPG